MLLLGPLWPVKGLVYIMLTAISVYARQAGSRWSKDSVLHGLDACLWRAASRLWLAPVVYRARLLEKKSRTLSEQCPGPLSS